MFVRIVEPRVAGPVDLGWHLRSVMTQWKQGKGGATQSLGNPTSGLLGYRAIKSTTC